MTKPFELLIAQMRIKKLERLLAGEIQAVADLLKENQRLETELEAIQNKLNAYKKYYECKKPIADKIRCNREEAMAIFARASSIGSDDSNGL